MSSTPKYYPVSQCEADGHCTCYTTGDLVNGHAHLNGERGRCCFCGTYHTCAVPNPRAMPLDGEWTCPVCGVEWEVVVVALGRTGSKEAGISEIVLEDL